jgi:hypothetical protein
VARQQMLKKNNGKPLSNKPVKLHSDFRGQSLTSCGIVPKAEPAEHVKSDHIPVTVYKNHIFYFHDTRQEHVTLTD